MLTTETCYNDPGATSDDNDGEHGEERFVHTEHHDDYGSVQRQEHGERQGRGRTTEQSNDKNTGDGLTVYQRTRRTNNERQDNEHRKDGDGLTTAD